ncbi:MAG: hypothetical protein NT139_00660 [Candidatus Woesearchaeota archaeon]|nr:hypothetical protein [Candidatus Woesearchaeota archaeon]
MKNKIPYFIEIRGCINCDASYLLKQKTGHDYGFDHEIMVKCVLYGCVDYSYDLTNPFFDPKETVRLAKNIIKENNNLDIIENAKKYCLNVKKKFGKFYDMIGVSIDDIINELN